MPNPDKILDRIRKLLARSTSSNPNESALAAAMASRLILEHQIDEAMIGDPLDPTRSEITEDTVFDCGRKLDQWRAIVALGVAKACSTRAFVRGSSIFMAGTKEDIQIANYLLGMIFNQLKDMGEDKYYIEGLREHKIAWMRSFYLGAAGVIRRRLEEEYKNQMEEIKRDESKSQAIMVIQGKIARVVKYMERYQMKSANSSSPPSSYAGYGAGVESGKRVKIGRGGKGLGRGDESRKRLTS